MTTVSAFFIGLLIGFAVAFIYITARYGKDGDDYYEGSDRSADP